MATEPVARPIPVNLAGSRNGALINGDNGQAEQYSVHPAEMPGQHLRLNLGPEDTFDGGFWTIRERRSLGATVVETTLFNQANNATLTLLQDASYRKINAPVDTWLEKRPTILNGNDDIRQTFVVEPERLTPNKTYTIVGGKGDNLLLSGSTAWNMTDWDVLRADWGRSTFRHPASGVSVHYIAPMTGSGGWRGRVNEEALPPGIKEGAERYYDARRNYEENTRSNQSPIQTGDH